MVSSFLEMTPDEALAYLQHTSLPTILVEGIGDSGLLRRIERDLSDNGVDLMSLGGKLPLHNVYLRRGEVANKVVVFLRDRDEYVVEVLPTEFSDYVLTGGYSIENDALSKDVIGNLCGDSVGGLSALISLVATWFRCALQMYVENGRAHDISRDVSWIVSDGAHSPEANAEIAATQLKQPFSELGEQTSWAWLRGKTLLRAIHYYFQSQDVQYSKAQLLDMSIKLGPSTAYVELIERLRVKVLARVAAST